MSYETCMPSASDSMLCTNSAYLHYKDQKTNDSLFLQQMSLTRPVSVRDIQKENTLFITQSEKVVSDCPGSGEMMRTRGGNVGCEPTKACPTLYTKYNMGEFLLTPCPKNTYKNYIVFDDTKMCSKTHQVLNNWTKRKDSL
jgi:hypothetical protein